MERGAAWVPLGEGRTTETVVIAQGDDDARRFSTRAHVRIAAMLSARRTIREAVIAVGDTVGGEGKDARAMLARALTLHMFASGRGSIVLGVGRGAGATLRAHLLALADTLSDETGGSVVEVSVRFGRDGAW